MDNYNPSDAEMRLARACDAMQSAQEKYLQVIAEVYNLGVLPPAMQFTLAGLLGIAVEPQGEAFLMARES